jgi:ketosteroid isomerase-like protein
MRLAVRSTLFLTYLYAFGASCTNTTKGEKSVSSTDLEALQARLDIRDVMDRYHAGINLRDFDLLESLFADDAVWDVGPPANVQVRGRAAIIDRMRQTVGHQEFLVQINCAVVIDLKDRDRATARSTIVEFGREPNGKGMQIVGFYEDELARVGRAWRYTKHAMRVRFVNDAPMPGTIVESR